MLVMITSGIYLGDGYRKINTAFREIAYLLFSYSCECASSSLTVRVYMNIHAYSTVVKSGTSGLP